MIITVTDNHTRDHNRKLVQRVFISTDQTPLAKNKSQSARRSQSIANSGLSVLCLLLLRHAVADYLE